MLAQATPLPLQRRRVGGATAGAPLVPRALTGSLEAIAQAKELINKVISNENDKAAMRGNLPTDTNYGGLHEMMIPGNLVARIIGKGGEVIKALQEDTGAKIVIIQVSNLIIRI